MIACYGLIVNNLTLINIILTNAKWDELRRVTKLEAKCQKQFFGETDFFDSLWGNHNLQLTLFLANLGLVIACCQKITKQAGKLQFGFTTKMGPTPNLKNEDFY
jgi:hypothetical protein